MVDILELNVRTNFGYERNKGSEFLVCTSVKSSAQVLRQKLSTSAISNNILEGYCFQLK